MNAIALLVMVVLPIGIMTAFLATRRAIRRGAQSAPPSERAPRSSAARLGPAILLLIVAGAGLALYGGLRRRGCDTLGGRYRVPLGGGFALDAYKYKGGGLGVVRVLKADQPAFDGEVKRVAQQDDVVVASMADTSLRVLDVRSGRDTMVASLEAAEAAAHALGVNMPALRSPKEFHVARCPSASTEGELIAGVLMLLAGLLFGAMWLVQRTFAM